ncbi:MAG TPA: hypothetical protein VJU15_06245 [Gemmatimonadales bacterium]|nr:hypothetical protein [Gemmatimonadales bacterium]
MLDKYEAKLRELLDAAEFARELTLCVVVDRSHAKVTAGRLMGPVE